MSHVSKMLTYQNPTRTLASFKGFVALATRQRGRRSMLSDSVPSKAIEYDYETRRKHWQIGGLIPFLVCKHQTI